MQNKLIDHDESQLFNSFIAGNESAFIHIYNKYSDMLLSYGIGLGFEREMIKDAIQDTFYKLYFNRKDLKHVINLKHYLFRMLKNKLLDVCKMTVDTCDIENYGLSFSISATVLDDLIEEEEKQVLTAKIEKLLNCLTNRQREAIYLRFMQEMNYEEIAELLNMTPQACRKLIFRAMERMREQNLPLFIFLLNLHFIRMMPDAPLILP